LLGSGFALLYVPTHAMSPTLIGETPEQAGDTLLVSAWGGRLGLSPGRFDVVAFRHPLDRSRAFIKRVVGLPDEEIALAAGDLYVRARGEAVFRIARKPVEVQRGLWLPVERTSLADRPATWLLPPDEQISTLTGADAPAGVLLDPAAADDRRVGVAYHRVVTDRARGLGGDQEVADLRLSATVALTRSGGRCVLALYAGAETISFVVAAGGKSSLRYADPARRASAEVAVRREFAPGADYRLEVWRYDRTAVAVVDGTAWARYEIPDDPNAGLPVLAPPAAAQLIAEEHPLRVTDLALDRDLFWRADGVLQNGAPLAVPAGCYVVLGDQTHASKDSRTWRMAELKLADGSTWFADADNVAETADGRVEVRSLDGELLTTPRAALANQVITWRPFVRDSDLIGRAWAVVWPLERRRWVR
ncbi:MAG: hypothetical protein HZA54_05990, partial [Planctomycetes bacterium]|nr:hypothetical protein [Planctomycetota bacterium]